MPFGIKKVRPDKMGRKYVVYRKDTGAIKSRHMTAAKAGASMGYAERGSKDIPKKKMPKGSPLHGLM